MQQEKLWSIYPYPCIGRFEFLNFKLPAYPAYPRILKLLRAGGTFLDAGCGIGQDLRFLKREGIPSSQLFGFDLLQEFIDVGYEVFMDTPEATGIRIQAADVFDEDSWVVREMAGKCAVVNLGYFLHLFSYEKQVKAAVMLARALKGSGGVLVGLHVQSWESSQFSHPIGGEAVWRHDGESFMKMWEEVGREVGCEFEVEVEEGVPFKRIEVDGKMWKKTGYVYQARFTATIV